MPTPRAQWGSRAGFILAAAGTAVGLGNIWKFPYVAGQNGGGVFILAYVVCVLLIGIPLMCSEVIIGRAAKKSPVSAIRSLGGGFWTSFGWLGVIGSASVLSYYSVIAGWALHYSVLSISGQLAAAGPEGVGQVFTDLVSSTGLNLFWHLAFMVLTVAVVLGGVSKGIDRWSRILMPALLAMLLGLVVRAAFLPGFSDGMDFAFGIRLEEFRPESLLAALGQAFFSLGVGFGGMLTYGSYLSKKDDIMSSSMQISALDSLVAILASIVIFPIIFTYSELEPTQGPGLLFASIPTGLIQMPFAGLLLSVFFVLLVFAALTSSIGLLEVPTSFLMDEFGWDRRRAALISGIMIFVYGIPSALSGVGGAFSGWLAGLDWIVTNLMLPFAGIGLSLFVGWRLDAVIRRDQYVSGTRFGGLYTIWLVLVKYLAPVAIAIVFLHGIGLLQL